MGDNKVKVSFIIGNKDTGEVRQGSFSMDAGIVLKYSYDDLDATKKFNVAAKITSGILTSHNMYGFYVSDEECQQHGLPNTGMTFEEFYAGFFKRFKPYEKKHMIFVVVENCYWVDDYSETSGCVQAFKTREDAIAFIERIIAEKSGVMSSDVGEYEETDESGTVRYSYEVRTIPLN